MSHRYRMLGRWADVVADCTRVVALEPLDVAARVARAVALGTSATHSAGAARRPRGGYASRFVVAAQWFKGRLSRSGV